MPILFYSLICLGALPSALSRIGATAQAPLLQDSVYTMAPDKFELKSGSSVFSPRDLIELPRPGTGIANPAGDLAFVQVSQHSFTENKSEFIGLYNIAGFSSLCVHFRTVRKIYVVTLNTAEDASQSLVLDGGDAFWLDSETIAHVHTPTEPLEQEIHAISLKYTTEPTLCLTSSPPVLVGKLPPGAAAR